jgi:hypothetical protein
MPARIHPGTDRIIAKSRRLAAHRCAQVVEFAFVSRF